jgi:hypothetical protein
MQGVAVVLTAGKRLLAHRLTALAGCRGGGNWYQISYNKPLTAWPWGHSENLRILEFLLALGYGVWYILIKAGEATPTKARLTSTKRPLKLNTSPAPLLLHFDCNPKTPKTLHLHVIRCFCPASRTMLVRTSEVLLRLAA